MNTTIPVNIAAVRIKPRRTPSPDPFIDGLRRLMADCGPNKHDQAIVVVTALIGQGIDTSDRMMPVLRRLGFNGQHVGIVLTSHTGVDPTRHYWRRDGSGVYALLGQELAAA